MGEGQSPVESLAIVGVKERRRTVDTHVHFIETKLAGAYLIELEPRGDARGFFARAYCRREMTAHGLMGEIAQCNAAFTHRRGTIRGLHYQVGLAAESKLVRCISGSIYDVMVDLRPNSPTFLQHQGVELNAEDRRQVYIPAGFGHGYQALSDNAEIFYMVSAFHSPEDERGIRYDDPVLGIEWPLPPVMVSDKDLGWPRFKADSRIEHSQTT